MKSILHRLKRVRTRRVEKRRTGNAALSRILPASEEIKTPITRAAEIALKSIHLKRKQKQRVHQLVQALSDVEHIHRFILASEPQGIVDSLILRIRFSRTNQDRKQIIRELESVLEKSQAKAFFSRWNTLLNSK